MLQDLLALNKALAVASWTCSLALLCLGMLETQGGWELSLAQLGPCDQ